MELEGHRKLTAEMTRGPDVVTERDNSLRRCEPIGPQMRDSERNRPADIALLKKWLRHFWEKYHTPDAKTVEVMALAQASTDWIPEW